MELDHVTFKDNNRSDGWEVSESVTKYEEKTGKNRDSVTSCARRDTRVTHALV